MFVSYQLVMAIFHLVQPATKLRIYNNPIEIVDYIWMNFDRWPCL